MKCRSPFLAAAISSEPYPEKNSQLDDVKGRLIAEVARMFLLNGCMISFFKLYCKAVCCM